MGPGRARSPYKVATFFGCPSDEDAEFFADNPHRTCRLREAFPDEAAMIEAAIGSPSARQATFAIVLRLGGDRHTRLYFNSRRAVLDAGASEHATLVILDRIQPVDYSGRRYEVQVDRRCVIVRDIIRGRQIRLLINSEANPTPGTFQDNDSWAAKAWSRWVDFSWGRMGTGALAGESCCEAFA
jgi:hypothetical protein